MAAARQLPPDGTTDTPPSVDRVDEERRLFEEAMQGVRPLPGGHGRVVPDWDRPGPSAPGHASPPAAREISLQVDGETVSGAAFGVAHDLLRSLGRGEIPPEAELDLHHLSAEVAVHSAQRFVEQSIEHGRRSVLLIHGRGHRSGPAGPVLRDAVVELLRRRPLAEHVLAFVSAPPQHGGAGSLLVLLRRKRG